MPEQKENEKENEVIPQKVDFSSYELGKLVQRSRGLLSFLKGVGDKVSVIQLRSVIVTLADFYNEKYSCIFVRQKYIAEMLNVSENTLRASFNTLLSSGIICAEEMSKDKRRKVYFFTKKFFDIILVDAQKILPSRYPTRLPVKNENTLNHCGYPYTIKNNVVSLNNVKQNFQKISDTDQRLPKYHHNTQVTGVDYPKYVPEKDVKQETPLDLSREKALEFILSLPLQARKGRFALELLEKHSFSPEELKPPD